MKRAMWFILMLSLLLLVMTSCTNSTERKYAKELNKAIDAENFDEVRRIISECPESVNTYPTLAPIWWQGEMWMTTIYYPLAEACKIGNLEMVKLLVENGADVNSLTPGWEVVTPIHTALLFGKGDWYNIVTYLIENGASVDYVDSDEKNAMLLDIIEGYREESEEDEENAYKLFAYVLENCDVTNVNWSRVLFNAIGWGRHNITKMLIEGGYCDVNVPYSGRTPLMCAISRSDAEMVKYLLDSGADINAVDEDGKSVLDYVAKCEDKEIKALFE